ncbi:MAG: hypothetical protein ACLSV2_03420 [Clostridium sp.]
MDTKILKNKACKVFIISAIIFMIYGVLKVNMTLPQVVRQNSGFYVTKNDQTSKVSIDVGEFNIILNGEPFKNFIKGIKVIGDNIKDLLPQ